MVFLGFMLTRGDPGATKAFYVFSVAGYNLGCFTIPFAQSFLGAGGVIATCLFDAGNSMMCTGLTYVIVSFAMAAGAPGQPRQRISLKEVGRKFLDSFCFMVYLTMLVLALLNIHLPQPVYEAARFVGNGNAFLSMLMIGMMFEISLDLKSLKQVATVLVTRYAVGLTLAWFFYFHTDFSLLIRQVLAMIMLAPSTSIGPIFISKLGGNVELASFGGSISILISVVLMTTFFSLIS